jgi:predicted nucleic-acid-binding protein
MIALDPNLLARNIVRDDPRQTAAATRLIESECSAEAPGVVTLVVLCELVWVLDRGYGYGRADIALVLRRILAADDLRAERSDLAWRALNEYEGGKADFADFVIGLSGREEKAAATYTFDRRAAGSELFRLVKA